MQKKLSYPEVLQKIDELRSAGLSDTDPQIRKLKVQLWGYLEKKNKKKSNKVVPTVMAIKTIKLNPRTLGNTKLPAPANTPTPANTGTELEKAKSGSQIEKQADKPLKPNIKYVLLGIIIAIAMVCYKFYKKD
jgi:hypothetical protein